MARDECADLVGGSDQSTHVIMSLDWAACDMGSVIMWSWKWEVVVQGAIPSEDLSGFW